VLVYFTDADVRSLLSRITAAFPGCRLFIDTYDDWIVHRRQVRGPLQATRARLVWACDDPKAIEGWGVGLRLVRSSRFFDPPPRLRARLGWRMRATLSLIRLLMPRRMTNSRTVVLDHAG
jgi:O-methyltransferase involved in polyketide biosynthesis